MDFCGNTYEYPYIAIEIYKQLIITLLSFVIYDLWLATYGELFIRRTIDKVQKVNRVSNYCNYRILHDL